MPSHGWGGGRWRNCASFLYLSDSLHSFSTFRPFVQYSVYPLIKIRKFGSVVQLPASAAARSSGNMGVPSPARRMTLVNFHCEET
jgi:hypothetical protein